MLVLDGLLLVIRVQVQVQGSSMGQSLLEAPAVTVAGGETRWTRSGWASSVARSRDGDSNVFKVPPSPEGPSECATVTWLPMPQ